MLITSTDRWHLSPQKENKFSFHQLIQRNEKDIRHTGSKTNGHHWGNVHSFSLQSLNIQTHQNTNYNQQEDEHSVEIHFERDCSHALIATIYTSS